MKVRIFTEEQTKKLREVIDTMTSVWGETTNLTDREEQLILDITEKTKELLNSYEL